MSLKRCSQYSAIHLFYLLSDREAPRQQCVYIHVRRAGSFSEQFTLLFRVYVRTHLDVASDYAQSKTGLAQQYPRVEDQVSSTEAQNHFIGKVTA